MCPLSVLAPIHVLSSEHRCDILHFEAQNVVYSDNEVLWTSDGTRDMRPDLCEYIASRQITDIQDMWVEHNTKRDAERLFEERPDYAPMGLLTRDGAIYFIDQETEPPTISQRTSVPGRRPLRHALLRREINNGKGDTWPLIVFDEQPCIIYRLTTFDSLVDWLDGTTVEFSAIRFTAPIAQILESCRVYAFILTEDGKAYNWRRDGLIPVQKDTLSEALRSPQTYDPTASNTPTGKTLVIHPMPVPPIVKMVVGIKYGAAITRKGQIYIFQIAGSDHTCTPLRRCCEATIADFYLPRSSEQPYQLYPDLTPRLTKIPDRDLQPTFINVAAGHRHLVALTSDGEVFTIGDGMQGQLGVGERRQHGLHAELNYMNELEDSWEFAEYWQKIEISDKELARGLVVASTAGKKGKVISVGAGHESTLLIVGPSNGGGGETNGMASAECE